MGNTYKPMAVSFQCMTKSTTKNNNNNKSQKKKKAKEGTCFRDRVIDRDKCHRKVTMIKLKKELGLYKRNILRISAEQLQCSGQARIQTSKTEDKMGQGKAEMTKQTRISGGLVQKARGKKGQKTRDPGPGGVCVCVCVCVCVEGQGGS